MSRYIFAIICIFSLLTCAWGASGQTHDPVDWVDIEWSFTVGLETSKEIKRLDGDGGGGYTDGAFTLTVSSGVNYSLQTDSGSASASGPDYYTGPMTNEPGGNATFQYQAFRIVAWAEPLPEPEGTHPRKWVQVFIPDPPENLGVNDPGHTHDGRWGYSTPPSGYVTLDFVGAMYQYESEPTPQNHTWVLNASGGSSEWLFQIFGWSLYDLQPLYKGPLPVSPNATHVGSTTARIVRWGPPWTPDDPDDPDRPEDGEDPGDDGGDDGGEDGDGDGDDGDGPPDPDEPDEPDEEPPPPPETGFDCIDDWLAETMEEGGLGEMINAFNSNTTETYTLNLEVPWVDGGRKSFVVGTQPGASSVFASPVETLRRWIILAFKIALTFVLVFKILTVLRQY